MSNFIHLEGEILQIKGATKVSSSTSSQAVVEIGEDAVILTGNDIEVKKLNLEEGEVCFLGKFNNIKLGSASPKKGSLIKRIFK